jgi:hypothetical protein
MTTARALIEGALRLIGQLAEGEIASNETYNDSLVAMNEMIDSLSIDRINVMAMTDQSITWPSTYATRTLGATGDITGTRPTLIDHAYIVSNDVTYPLVLVTDEQYSEIASKDTTSTLPTLLRASMTVPAATLTVWPVPTGNVEIHLVSMAPLTQPATLLTELVLAPGYRKMFRFNLAVALAAEFGKSAPGEVVVGANQSKAAIQRVNTPLDTLRMPSGMPGCGGGTFDIYSGN